MSRVPDRPEAAIDQPAFAPGIAGASARGEYERRQANRETTTWAPLSHWTPLRHSRFDVGFRARRALPWRGEINSP
jgi:hypothetical protein